VPVEVGRLYATAPADHSLQGNPGGNPSLGVHPRDEGRSSGHKPLVGTEADRIMREAELLIDDDANARIDAHLRAQLGGTVKIGDPEIIPQAVL
jgi:hypothetical protein